MFLSAISNVLIGFQSSIVIIAVLWGFNGYFQSMLWSPGIALLSNWWPGEKRGFATGFAKAFSGFGQVCAALTVSLSFIILPNSGWKAGFIFPAVIMIAAGIIYIFVAKDSPKTVSYTQLDVYKRQYQRTVGKKEDRKTASTYRSSKARRDTRCSFLRHTAGRYANTEETAVSKP